MNGQTMENTTKISQTTIDAAMRFVYDTMESALIPDYFILGEAGRAVNDGQLISTDKIEIGIRKAEMTPEVVALFKVWNFKEEADRWTYSFEGLPIHFRIISRNYPWFKHLDTKFYGVDEFHVPNPFEKYWTARYIVK